MATPAVQDWSKLPTLAGSGLKTLDIKALAKPWDGRLKVDFGDGQTDVAPTQTYRAPPMRRSMKDLRTVNRHAIEHLAAIPEPGEALHFIIGDRVSLWDIVPALLDRVQPETIASLCVSTLSFSSGTAAALLSLIDDGKIARVRFLVSVMFSAKNRSLYEELIPQLQARGHPAAAMRTHCKIMAIELSDGRRYTVESSSNLRSCSCAEQVTLIRDDGLYEFHRDWITRAAQGVK